MTSLRSVVSLCSSLICAAVVSVVVAPAAASTFWQAIPLDARAIGMGGAHAGVLEGPDAARWNPAVPVSGTPLALSWSRISEYEFLPINRWSGAASIESRNVRASLIHDRVKLGPFGYAESVSYHTTDLISLSADMPVATERRGAGVLTWGLGLRRDVQEFRDDFVDPEGVVRKSIGIDFGLSYGSYRAFDEGDLVLDWRFGGALMNGIRPVVDEHAGEESDLRLGAALGLALGRKGPDDYALRVLTAFDWSKTFNHEPEGYRTWEQRLGVEVLIQEFFAIRAGAVDHETNTLIGKGTWGCGMIYDDPSCSFSMRVDYARGWLGETFVSDRGTLDHYSVSLTIHP